MSDLKIDKVAVIGAGFMGTGITQVTAAGGFDGTGQRFGLHDHAATAAIGTVVGNAMASFCKIADIHGRSLDLSVFYGLMDNAVAPERLEHLRENG